MARLARVVAPGCPHHVTQRGNCRQQTFFCDANYRAYLDLMAEWCERCGVEIWAYCLMPNHVHLIATPETAQGLRRAIGEAHRRYTRHVSRREDWRVQPTLTHSPTSGPRTHQHGPGGRRPRRGAPPIPNKSSPEGGSIH